MRIGFNTINKIVSNIATRNKLYKSLKRIIVKDDEPNLEVQNFLYKKGYNPDFKIDEYYNVKTVSSFSGNIPVSRGFVGGINYVVEKK